MNQTFHFLLTLLIVCLTSKSEQVRLMCHGFSTEGATSYRRTVFYDGVGREAVTARRSLWSRTKRTTAATASITSISLFGGRGRRGGSRNTDKEGSGDGNEAFDTEKARRQLESLMDSRGNNNGNGGVGTDMRGGGDELLESLLSSSSFLAFELPPPPPITSMERDCRSTEIDILKHLLATEEDADQACSALWSLWFSERGPLGRAALERADELMAATETWKDCEDCLTDMIREHGVYFVEPLNRLATLYFLQGKHDKSYKLCTVILEIKPWHFGALSGIVAVCMALGDREKAMYWAARRLPTINNLERRMEWVDRAVANAKDSLERAEVHLQESFGTPEEYYAKEIESDDPEAWQ